MVQGEAGGGKEIRKTNGNVLGIPQSQNGKAVWVNKKGREWKERNKGTGEFADSLFCLKQHPLNFPHFSGL